MSVRAVRWAVIAYMLLFLLATTWPGAMLFNHVQPLVLGLPFNLFVIALLIIGALGLLTALYISEQRTGTK
ncbi:MAG: hypothetical protein AAFY34_13335 [Pseudomonadota bacterium]